MEFKKLKERQIIEKNVRLNNSYNQFGVLISKLKEKNIPEEIINKINILIFIWFYMFANASTKKSVFDSVDRRIRNEFLS